MPDSKVSGNFRKTHSQQQNVTRVHSDTEDCSKLDTILYMWSMQWSAITRTQKKKEIKLLQLCNPSKKFIFSGFSTKAKSLFTTNLGIYYCSSSLTAFSPDFLQKCSAPYQTTHKECLTYLWLFNILRLCTPSSLSCSTYYCSFLQGMSSDS